MNAIFSSRNILWLAPTELEQKAVRAGLGKSSCSRVEIVGVGSVGSAVKTTQLLQRAPHDLVILIGIAGGFGATPLGSLVAADYGVETDQGIVPLETLGLGQSRIKVQSPLWEGVRDLLRSAALDLNVGTILTVSTVTGTQTTADALLRRYPQACTEAMEGFGVAAAAQSMGIPFLELRAVSNLVGPRDRDSWQIELALGKLTEAVMALSQGCKLS
jgi:futalosine hydrolase